MMTLAFFILVIDTRKQFQLQRGLFLKRPDVVTFDDHNFSFINYHFYSRKIWQYIAWACLRNGHQEVGNYRCQHTTIPAESVSQISKTVSY